MRPVRTRICLALILSTLVVGACAAVAVAADGSAVFGLAVGLPSAAVFVAMVVRVCVGEVDQ